MANIVWPTSLPAFEEPLLSSYNEKPGTTTVRTEMEVGPAKIRKRTTAEVDRFEVAYIMTGSQVATFDGFYDSTTAQGALRFDATHPRTGNTVEVRFRDRPQFKKSAPDVWRVSFPVEVMP